MNFTGTKRAAKKRAAPTPSPEQRLSRSAQKQVAKVEMVRRLRIKAAVVTHTDPDKKTIAKRSRLERNLGSWFRHMFPEIFYLPFSPDHREVISTITHVLDHGGNLARAMSRGDGKTTMFRCAMLYAALTGKRKFLALVQDTGGQAAESLEFFKKQLMLNDRLHEYYPHVTAYTRICGNHQNKAATIRRSDEQLVNMRWLRDVLVLPSTNTYGQKKEDGTTVTLEEAKDYPSNGAILKPYGISGAIRGDNYAIGTMTFRPDFVLIDDPQNRESARSDTQTTHREKLIDGDIMGLAGPNIRIAGVMACTIIEQGDLAARYLDTERHPEWSGKAYKMATKFPAPREKSAEWLEYEEVYRQCLIDQDLTAANRYYRKHRKKIDKQITVTWKHRKRDGAVSAEQNAINLYVEQGDQFFSEYQNDPKPLTQSVYTLTPELIQSRADPDAPPGITPEWVAATIATTDINPTYTLASSMVGFGLDQRAAVLWYALHPMHVSYDQPDPVKTAAIIQELTSHEHAIISQACRPDAWIIDGGGSPKDTVITFAALSQQRTGIPTIAAFGRGWRNFKPGRKSAKQFLKPGHELNHILESRTRQWIIWNADHWREAAQKGWLAAPGSPGSCSLPRGEHTEFATQICREQLTSKATMDGQTVWIWHTAPGEHEFGDCQAMAYMGAAWLRGIGSPDAFSQQKPKQKKIRAAIGRPGRR